MIKTIEFDGVTEVKVKDSPYSMERFCRIKNLSDNFIFASCENKSCGEDENGVRRIAAGECEIIDTENYDTVYLNGTGKAEIVTSAYASSLFRRALKGGDDSGNEDQKLLSEALIRCSFPQGRVCADTNDYIDTYIPQSVFSPEKGITAVFVINPKTWGNYHGLLGDHGGSPTTGIHIQYGDGKLYTFLTNHETSTIDNFNFIDKKMVFITADSADDVYLMVDGTEVSIESEERANKIYNYDLILLRSTKGYSDRTFQGIVHEAIVFNKYLSKNEALKLTQVLSKMYSV